MIRDTDITTKYRSIIGEAAITGSEYEYEYSFAAVIRDKSTLFYTKWSTQLQYA